MQRGSPAVALAYLDCLSRSTAEACACRPVLVAAYSAREAAADDSPQVAGPVAAQPAAALPAGEPARFAEAGPGYAADSARVDSVLEKADDRCVRAAGMDGSPDDCSAPLDSAEAEADSPDSADSAQAGLTVAGSAADDYSAWADPVAPMADDHSVPAAGTDGSPDDCSAPADSAEVEADSPGSADSVNSLLAGWLAPACSPAEAVERADSFQADCSRPADCPGDFPPLEAARVSPAGL